MKSMKKLLAFALVLVMLTALSATAFAATTQTKALDPADADNATIKIMNPAKGETYNVIKLFDATVDGEGNIAYQGTIPSTLSAYFEVINAADGTTNYVKLKSGVDNDALFAALETWAASATPTATETSNGADELAFTGLPYGYYVITTTHKDTTTGKAAITVDSTNPNAEVFDKNETKIVNEGKESDGTSYSVGDTITYTAKFLTTNYYGSGSTAGKIYKYVIEDTLPEFLSNVTISSITIGGTAWADAPSTFTNKQITIPWVDENENSLYANGAEIVVVYTAKLTSLVNVNAANKNTISITPYDKNNEPYSDPFSKTNEITTYAAALQKTDGTTALAGAKFKFYGLTLEETATGVYTVVSYDPSAYDASAEEQDTTKLGTEVSTDADGKLYIIGLGQNVTLTGVETVAPDGYNKLDGVFTMPAQVLETEVFKESGTRYYDADGNLVAQESSSTSSKTVEKNLSELDATGITVVNNAGTELPSTGGIGTTLFYVFGAILVLGAGVVLVTKRRVQE